MGPDRRDCRRAATLGLSYEGKEESRSSEESRAALTCGQYLPGSKRGGRGASMMAGQSYGLDAQTARCDTQYTGGGCRRS